MRRLRLIFVLVFAAGCASTTVKPVPNDAADRACGMTGFRYYESSPYILVTSDGKTGLKTELKYLPDLTKKRSIELKERLASNTATLTFEDGVLTLAKNKGDATAVPKAIVDAAKAAAAAAVKLGILAIPESGVPPQNSFAAPAPLLFKLVRVGKDWKLVGEKSGSTVNVHVPEGEP